MIVNPGSSPAFVGNRVSEQGKSTEICFEVPMEGGYLMNIADPVDKLPLGPVLECGTEKILSSLLILMLSTEIKLSMCLGTPCIGWAQPISGTFPFTIRNCYGMISLLFRYGMYRYPQRLLFLNRES